MAEAAKNILSRVDFLQLIPHKSTTGKRFESKGLQRIRTCALSLSGDVGSSWLLFSQARFCIGYQTDGFQRAQSTFDPLSTPGHLALFPQARGFEARRTGNAPAIEAGQSTR